MKGRSIVTSMLLLGAWGVAAQQQPNTSNAQTQSSTPHAQPGNISSQASPAADTSRQAEQLLRAACQYLAEAPFFSLDAEIWREHIDDAGQKVQFARQADMQIKRPDRLRAEIFSPHSQRGFWYDGKSLAILDRKRNLFSTTSMPGNLDGALDAAHDQFGIDLPLIDLALSDPYKSAMAKVKSATYFGLATAIGFQCHHLAFTQDNIDWQIWIQDGPQPLIRKFVITHKNEEGSPEFTALIRDWDFVNRISESNFAFEPPSGAMKIEMRKDGEAGPAVGEQTKPSAPAVSPTGR